MKNNGYRVGGALAGIGAAIAAEFMISNAANAQTWPEPAHIISGKLYDKNGLVEAGTKLTAEYKGVDVRDVAADAISNKTLGNDGEFEIQVNTDSPATPDVLEGAPRDSLTQIYAIDKNGGKHMLRYLRNGNILDYIIHESGFTRIDSLFTPDDLDKPVSSDGIRTGNTKLKAYPNPTDGMLKIETPEGDYVKAVKVFDSSGRLFEYDVNKTRSRVYEIDMEDLPAGVWFVNVETGSGKRSTEKISIY